MAYSGIDSRRSSIGMTRTDEDTGRRASGRLNPTRGSSNSQIQNRSTETRHEHSADRSLPSGLTDKPQKHVSFVHILPDTRQCARLPMRVMISPHDNTESIIATVKNFYGLYGPGVCCQDRDGNILVAAYDNFENDMTVYVKETIVEPKMEPELAPDDIADRASSEKPRLGAAFEMRPPSTHRYSVQTDGLDQRSYPQMHGSADADGDHDDAADSDGDVSVTSSRRSRAEAHVSADITVDNIVEGGRRKRAKFESFELPLFVPPQISAGSLSSISPQRRAPSGFDGLASPLHYSNNKPFMYGHPGPSPQNPNNFDGQQMPNWSAYGNGRYSQFAPQQQAQYSGQQQSQIHAPNLPLQRGMGHMQYSAARQPTGGILPTPEPTVGSVISDEDVALQLMRLGDSISHGRTSTSTADDSFSRQADVSSEDDMDSREKPGRHEFKRARLGHEQVRRQSSGRSSDGTVNQQHVYSSDPEYDLQGMPQGERMTGSRKSSKSKHAHRASHSGSTAASGTESSKLVKPGPASLNGPMSPASIEPQSRRMSTASGVLLTGEEEDDISSKPRCQRCRKSKKGCDRVQPVCGRCKDAGVGPEGCVPEDEVNGRKGRYGRPVGLSVKNKLAAQQQHAHDPAATGPTITGTHVPGEFLVPGLPAGDKNKKRKR